MFSSPCMTRGAGINMRIMRCLRQFGRAVPIGFLAEEIGYTTPVVKRYLIRLKERGVVRLEDDMVSIAYV